MQVDNKTRVFTVAEIEASENTRKTAAIPQVLLPHLGRDLALEINVALLENIERTHLTDKHYDKIIAVSYYRKEGRIAVTIQHQDRHQIVG